MLPILSLVSLASYRLWSQGVISTSESGLLEVGQNIFLLLACLLYSYHSYDDNADSLYRLLYRGLALFCLTLLLRELDIDRLGGVENGRWEMIELSVRGAALLGVIIYCGAWIRSPDIQPSRIKILLSRPTMSFIYWGAFCYLCTWPFDKSLLAIPQSTAGWIEETLELNATILFFSAACIKFFATDASLLPDLVHDSGSRTAVDKT